MSGTRQRLRFEKTRRRADSAWQRAESGWTRFERSTAWDVWNRLASVDFMNQALLLAAVMLLWLFPNLIFLTAASGRSFANSLVSHMGLNSEAEQSVNSLFKPSAASLPATVGAVAFLVMAVVATVALIQKIWQTIWGLDGLGYWHEVWRQLVFGTGILALSVGVSYAQHELNKVSPVLAAVVTFLAIGAFFWLGIHLLLGGRVPYRELLFPAAVTSAFFLGLGAFSSAVLSAGIVANDKEYGPIGVVFIIMTWLLALGVVFMLGPVVGVAVQARLRDRRRLASEGPPEP